MGRRRNKLKNAAFAIGLSFFRHEYKIVKIAHVGIRTRSENQFLNAKVQFNLVPPHYVCSGDGTALEVQFFKVWSGSALLSLSSRNEIKFCCGSRQVDPIHKVNC